MEMTQDYLRHCLQIAQEKGILDLITRSKGEFQESPLSLHALNSTPTSPPIPINPASHHPNLAAITDQAKINGWYINPTEVSIRSLNHQYIFHTN